MGDRQNGAGATSSWMAVGGKSLIRNRWCGLHLVRLPDKDAPPGNGRAFRRARPEPIHRR